MNVPTYDILDCGTLASINTTLPLIAEGRNCLEVIVQADPNNTANVVLGDALVQCYVLEPGATLTIPIRHINKIFVRFPSDTTQRVNWIAMR